MASQSIDICPIELTAELNHDPVTRLSIVGREAMLLMALIDSDIADLRANPPQLHYGEITELAREIEAYGHNFDGGFDSDSNECLGVIQHGYMRGNYDVWNIERLVVDPTTRHRGIGSRLLQHAIDNARQNDAKAVKLWSVSSAVRFYEKQGFRCGARVLNDVSACTMSYRLRQPNKTTTIL